MVHFHIFITLLLPITLCFLNLSLFESGKCQVIVVCGLGVGGGEGKRSHELESGRKDGFSTVYAV